MEEKTGTITDIVFRNDENGYTVAVMETETEYFTVVGNLPQCVKGSRFRLTGIFKNHPTYGEQFAFKEFEEIMPDDSDAICEVEIWVKNLKSFCIRTPFCKISLRRYAAD